MAKTDWKTWIDKVTNQNHTLITLPKALEDTLWEPNNKDRECAYALLTEMQTRISTQRLPFKDGDEVAALDSLYNVFTEMRKIIKSGGIIKKDEGEAALAWHFSFIATFVMNNHIRPFTAKWHMKKIAGQLKSGDDCLTFRAELTDLQEKLKYFTDLLGQMAIGDKYFPTPTLAKPPGNIQPDLSGDILFDRILLIDTPSNNSSIYEGERKSINERRETLDQLPTNLVGLACSGGGIRSATFCLGVAQELSQQGHKGLLSEVDYLSTVSGGGYFGSFLTEWLDKSTSEKCLQAKTLPFYDDKNNTTAEPAPIRHLRNDSKYLLSGGPVGQSRMIGSVFFGFFINLLVIFSVVVLTAAITQMIKNITPESVTTYNPYLLFLIPVVMIAGLPFYMRQKRSRFDKISKYTNKIIYSLTFTFLVLTIVSYLPSLHSYAEQSFSIGARQAFFFNIFLPIVFILAAIYIGLKSSISKILIPCSLVIMGFSILLNYHLLLYLFLSDLPTGWLLILIGTSTLAILWVDTFNINDISPHHFYRNRLSRCYLEAHDKSKEGDSQNGGTKISELKNKKAPYHLINAALNIPSSKNKNLRGRRSDFFIFSKKFCGSPISGYVSTYELEQHDPNLNLGTAMAISGAAAAPHMGTLPLHGAAFWLSLLNIRLAYWIPNPSKLIKDSQSRATPLAFSKELFSNMDENDEFLSLSDGGHIENLAIYELLRRRCKYIIAIDAEADPDMKFPGLMTLIRLASIDFGTEIRIDLSDLTKNPDGNSKAHFALGSIHYNENNGGGIGYLLYIKSSLTGNEVDYVKSYQQNNPSFPHETTADQFFSEEQFEVYRALGQHVAKDLFEPEILKGDAGASTQPLTIDQWFNKLAFNLLK